VRLRISGRHDSLLLAGFTLAALITFQPAIQHGLDVARDIERTYGLSLVPTLIVLSVMFIFHLHANRREMKAEAAAAAVETALARARATELEQLMVFGQALARVLSTDALREVVWRHLPALAGADDAAWALLRSDAGWTRITDVSAATWGAGDLEAIADAAIDTEAGEQPATGVGIDGHVCFVMRVRAEPVGVLGLRAQYATPDTRGKLATAAALLTIAARNAQLFAEIRDTSLKDSLTGCFNRAHALEAMEAEFARARRTRLPLAVIMFDVDLFKHLNDRAGHLAGDAVLAAVGARLRDMLRRSDLRSRYGGDEFLIVLPDTNLEGASHLAEALRTELSTLQLSSADCQLSITISAGVACAEPDDRTAKALVQRADEALYSAKAAGRNCVRSARGAGRPPAEVTSRPFFRTSR
jgi:diguanylate cyclase (GGDEF)-like protein